MKLYTIANATRECYGQGDYGVEQRITRRGPYGTGEFPPVFTDPTKAEEWMAKNVIYGVPRVVVELEVVGL